MCSCPSFRKLAFLFFEIYQNIYFFENVPIFLLYCCRYLGIFKSIYKGSQGLKNPDIMEFRGDGPSHNKTEILLDQK